MGNQPQHGLCNRDRKLCSHNNALCGPSKAPSRLDENQFCCDHPNKQGLFCRDSSVDNSSELKEMVLPYASKGMTVMTDVMDELGEELEPPQAFESSLTATALAGLQPTANASRCGGENLTQEDGTSYDGELVGGLREGFGLWRSSSSSYAGEWRNNLQEGYGTQLWVEHDRTYEGHFSSGHVHGDGRMSWISPHGWFVYEGQYVMDIKHGTGKFTWPDGRIYDGDWREGKRWGKGDYTNLKGRVRPGIWVQDKFERWLDGESVEEGAFCVDDVAVQSLSFVEDTRRLSHISMMTSRPSENVEDSGK